MKSLFRYLFVPVLAVFFTIVIFNWVKEYLPDVQKTNAQDQGQGEVLIGGGFELKNQNDEVVTDKDFLGKHMLVYFGFTNCSMICPTDMSEITQALELLNEEQLEGVQPIFITIDPKRDDVEQIKSFVSNFHPKFQGLTGTEERIKATVSAYRVYAKQMQSEDLSDYMMDHSAYIYLMGTDGKYVTHFRHGQPAEEIAENLKKYL